MADQKKSGSSNNKRQQPSLEAAICAEKEEIDELEQEQEAPSTHALVRSSPVGVGAADTCKQQKDTWSENLTALLLNLYTQNYLPTRRFLSKEEWLAITNSINSRIGNPSLHKTPSQVHSKINTLRKRYRKECERGSSDWPFFQQMHDLTEVPKGEDAGVSRPLHAGHDHHHAEDNRQDGVKTTKKSTYAGPDDRSGPDIQAEMHIKNLNRYFIERNNNKHDDSGYKRTWGEPRHMHDDSGHKRTWGEPRNMHEDPHFGHPRFSQQHFHENPWFAVAKAFDNFSNVYKNVEMHKINAYTELVTKLVDRRN